MKKTTLLKIVMISVLLLGCVSIAAFVFDAIPLVKTKPEDRSLDQLLNDMDVEIIPFGAKPFEVRLQDLNGADIDISDFRGKIVALNFWATWCPICVIDMLSLEKLHKKLKGKNFVLVAVSIRDSVAEVKRFAEQNKLIFTFLLDSTGKTLSGFGIHVIPTTLIIDKSGRIFGRILGPREWASRQSVAMFKHLIEEPVSH